MSVILHIAKKDDWIEAQASGSYRVGSLATQGFIHCSTPEQVIAVANSVFHGQRDLVLLGIDTAKVAAEIKLECPAGGKEPYPHIYGPLNVDAVTHVIDFIPLPDGTFELPKIYAS